jgi:hypothetical protein
VVLLTKEMGWEIDYTLSLTIGQFYAVSEVLSEWYLEQNGKG